MKFKVSSHASDAPPGVGSILSAHRIAVSLEYGQFLAGIGKPDIALPHLQKALDKGLLDAEYALGLSQLALGKNTEALELLTRYQQRHPDQTQLSRMVEAIRQGNVEIKRMPNTQNYKEPTP